MTQFELFFNGGERSIFIDGPDKDGVLGMTRKGKIDGLDELHQWLLLRSWFYSNGKLIQVSQISFITLVPEKRNTDPVDD